MPMKMTTYGSADGSAVFAVKTDPVATMFKYMESAIFSEVATLIAKAYVEKHGDEIISQLEQGSLVGATRFRVLEMLSESSRDRTRELMSGICPECKQNPIANLKHPSCFAPEWAESMRERNISTQTGHRKGCRLV